MENETLIEFVLYSDNQENYVELGAYVDTSDLKHILGLKPSDSVDKKIENISSEETQEIIEKIGTKKIVVL
ncbi:hypothetical protein [Enterococcus casseliflavus]|uniref:hypothetical protein n=1 Tax=Enterococcus casseliflavus TaxID=37734 RepID=UPI003017DA52